MRARFTGNHALAMVLWTVAAAASAGQLIEITEFEAKADGAKVTVILAAKPLAADVEIPSICLGLVGRPGPLPPGFHVRDEKNAYLDSQDYGASGPNHKDNGKLDADPADGRWSITMDTAGWTPGEYSFKVVAHNRPKPGPYIVAERNLAFAVKDGMVVLRTALPLRYGVEDASKPAIQITEWNREFDGSLIKLAWAAQSNRANVAIASFTIRAEQQPPDFKIPGMAVGNGGFYNLHNPGNPSSHWLLDNGVFDLDNREGHYLVHIDTKGYKPGVYAFKLFVHNVPGGSPWIYDSRDIFFEITADGELRAVGTREALPGMENAILFMEDGYYGYHPGLVVRPDGKWVTRFAARTVQSHIRSEGGARTLISDDEGRTWTRIEDTDPLSASRMALTEDGSKLVNAFAEGWVAVPEEEGDRLKEEMRHVMHSDPGKISYLGGNAFKKVSSDGGKTWTTTKIDVPDDINGLMGYTPASAMKTKEGVRLHAIYGSRFITDPDGKRRPGGTEAFILRSEDDGETWTFIPVLPRAVDPAKQEQSFDETAVAQAADGSVILMLRANFTSFNLWISRSTDLGKTWSTPTDTGVKGFPADMITLADGRILCVYGYRFDPPGIRAVISADGGRTWSEPIVLRDDGVGGDLGYPSVLQREDGKVFTIYYMTSIVDGVEKTYIASTVWDPATVAP